MTTKPVFDPALREEDRLLLQRFARHLVPAARPAPAPPKRRLTTRLSAFRNVHYRAAVAAATHHGSYLLSEDFDRTSRPLLDRAQRAVDRVMRSEARRSGLLDAVANETILPQRLWDIARTLADQVPLRRAQEDAFLSEQTPALRSVLNPQIAALAHSVTAVTAQIEALEHYSRRVGAIDAAFLADRLRDDNHRYEALLTHTPDPRP